ncbi:MAG: VWA domain-containing protein [Pandoraea sp.]|nr:VWA domain-containing protein [Pandoraea sp.]MDR3398836.1 VWA domain-containing protein [Pandoraea sp.]
MEIDLSAFHFLRPIWLWLLVPALVLPVVWRRRSDVRARWRKFIAPALLEHLLVGDMRAYRLQPVHTIAMLLAVGALAAAAPTWEQVSPPFSQDKAPMVIAVSLARSMNATDVPPTRLERAKAKVLDLARARKGARTGLVVFAGTSHLVVPPTEDPAMLELYVPALATDLMPTDGKRMDLALDVAERLLAHDTAAGTIVFIGDGFDAASRDAFIAKAKASKQQLLWLAAGTAKGGAVRNPDGTIAVDANGAPVTAGFDAEGMRKLASEAGIPLASLRADGDDVVWVQRRAQTYLADMDEAHREPRWQESGFWLVVPVLLLVLVSFRRGWTVKWLPVVVLSFTLPAMPEGVRAADAAPQHDGWRWIDAFATRDQQGRWYFSKGDFATAAARFEDPMWKGRAQYAAGDFDDALATFSQIFSQRKDDTSAFYMGNSLAHLGDYAGAIKAYTIALQQHPGWVAATANFALMKNLLKAGQQPDDTSQQVSPDDVKYDGKKAKGPKQIVVSMAPAEDVWMRGLNTSPAIFLRQRFEQEAATPVTKSAAGAVASPAAGEKAGPP